MATNEQWRGKLSDGNNFNTYAGTSAQPVGGNTALGAAEPFTGTGEKNDYPDVMVSCYSDTAGTLYFEFSVDNVNWRTFPSSGFGVAAGIHEFHTAVKGSRYFRVVFVNGSSVQSVCQIFTYFGTFRQPSAPLNQSISDDVDSIVVRSVLVGQNNKGDYTNVPVDGNGALRTDFPKTAFGEVLTGQLSPIFQYSFEYTVDNTELTKSTVANGGTVTQSTAMAVMNTSTTTASTALMQSVREAKYRAGMGATFRFTALYTSPVAGCDQLAGLADETGSSQPFKNGYMIGYLGTTFGVHRFVNDTVVTVALASCDDPLDGTGTSGMTIDPTKINVFEIRFQYLGAGKIEFLIEDDSTGVFVVFHKVLFANNNTVPSVYMPNFRATFWADNGGTTSDITLKTASCAYFVEGIAEPILTHRPEFSSGKQEKTGLSTEIAIFTIRNKSSYASKTNFIELWLLGISAAVEASGNALTTVRLIKNTTLGGTPSWADINTANSIVEIDTAGTTVTGGTELFEEVISGQRGNLFQKIQDWTIILDPGETLTISASTRTGTATVDGSLLWKELF